jgi:hypothetical protein
VGSLYLSACLLPVQRKVHHLNPVHDFFTVVAALSAEEAIIKAGWIFPSKLMFPDSEDFSAPPVQLIY